MLTRLCKGCVAAMLMLAGCSSSGSPSCAPSEALLESNAIHVLPGTAVTYSTSPPTSGPHQFPAPSPGVLAEPIDEPNQVAGLEEGLVLIQYRSTVDSTDVELLQALAENDRVVVAPGIRPFDDSATVAFTAWGHRQLCSATDANAAQEFIDRHARAGTDHQD